MPSLSHHQSQDFVKLLLIGDAKTGKTGSLISLVKAGYKLRILDLDNLLDILRHVGQRECPELLDNIEYKTVRDRRKATATGMIIDGPPKAYVEAIKLIDHWKYKDENGNETDFGKPSSWGSDCVLVIDSLSRLCDACYDWRVPLTPTGKGGEYDGRAVYGDAQDAILDLLQALTSPGFKTNVIVIAHVQYMEQPDKTTKGFPQGVGQKLSPKIPQFFPSVVLYTRKGDRRTLQTNSTPVMDLANPKPFEMAQSYPIETGLADFFKVLKPHPNTEPTKPKAVTLVRK